MHFFHCAFYAGAAWTSPAIPQRYWGHIAFTVNNALHFLPFAFFFIAPYTQGGVVFSGEAEGKMGMVIIFNDIWSNGTFGVRVCGKAGLLVTRNTIHHHADIGVFFQDAHGFLEDNHIWGGGKAAVQISGEGGDVLIASNRIHGAGVGLACASNATGRLRILGNALWDCAVGVRAVFPPASAFRATLDGNLFARNGYGVTINRPSKAVELGLGNSFSHCEKGEVLRLAGGADGPFGADLARLPKAPSCAFCAKDRIPKVGLRACSGCVKFGADFSPRYCGRECQTAHWEAHRAECPRAESRERARAVAYAAAADALLTPPPPKAA